MSHVRFTALSAVQDAAPVINSLSDTTLSPGEALTINGNNFGASQGSSTVDVRGVVQTVNTWSNTTITISSVSLTGVPNGSAYVRVDVN